MPKSFSDLGINEQFQQSLVDLQISVPTDIQEKTIPVVLNQKEDLVVLAKTGTGKTAAFGLPLLQLIDVENTNVQTLILAPTRELGQQIYTNLIKFFAAETSHKPVSSSSCSVTIFNLSTNIVNLFDLRPSPLALLSTSAPIALIKFKNGSPTIKIFSPTLWSLPHASITNGSFTEMQIM